MTKKKPAKSPQLTQAQYLFSEEVFSPGFFQKSFMGSTIPNTKPPDLTLEVLKGVIDKITDHPGYHPAKTKPLTVGELDKLFSAPAPAGVKIAPLSDFTATFDATKLRKAAAELSTLTADGEELTTWGWDRVALYAEQWLKGIRDLLFERQYPELRSWFYDIRCDTDAAEHYGAPPSYVIAG